LKYRGTVRRSISRVDAIRVDAMRFDAMRVVAMDGQNRTTEVALQKLRWWVF
jgi:hypothetical protein